MLTSLETQTTPPVISTREDVIAHIQSALPDLPPAQGRVAHFMMNALSQVPFMTTTALAEAAETSQATVTRLVLSLGFSSYLDFSNTVSRVLLDELGESSPPERFEQSRHRAGQPAFLQQEAQHVLDLADLVQGQTFRRVVRTLLEAQEVVVVGFGASACLAVHSGLYLSRLRPVVRTVTALTTEQAISTLHLGPKTQALVFAVPRITTDQVQYLTLLQRAGVPVTLVAGQASSPLVPYATELLLVPTSQSPTTSVPAAMLVLGSLLADALAQAQPEQTAARLAAFEARLVQEARQVLPEPSVREVQP